MSHLAVAPAEAIGFLTLLIRWNGGVVPLYADGEQTTRVNGPSVSSAGARIAELAHRLDFEHSQQAEIGLPYGTGTILWCWLETRDSVRRARRFRPAPTMVLRMGASCRRLAIWGLKEAVGEHSIIAANKRLAYHLRAPQKYADPQDLRVPLPGTFLRVGRKRPAPVLVTVMELERSYARSQVVARLKDPPTPYMQRLREGTVR